jgi:hypothetical protein
MFTTFTSFIHLHINVKFIQINNNDWAALCEDSHQDKARAKCFSYGGGGSSSCNNNNNITLIPS